MERAAENRTMLIVAHRLSTVRQADCIFVLDHGEILEEGTHDGLLEKQGCYYKLWQESVHSGQMS